MTPILPPCVIVPPEPPAVSPQTPMPVSARHAIAQAFAAHIRTHLVSPALRMSVLSYGIVTALKGLQVSLTPAEIADLDMISAIDAWETACVEARNTSLSADPPTPPEAWPAPPPGLAAFLTDF